MNSSVQQEVVEETSDSITKATYFVSDLELNDGSIIFNYISYFLSFIIKHDDLPIDVLKAAFETKVSLLEIIQEALKVESGFICLVIIFIFIAIIPLIITIIWQCQSYNDNNKTDNNYGSNVNIPVNNLTTIINESSENKIICRKRILSFLLQLIILFLIIGVIGLFITNEQISTAIKETSNFTDSSVKDIESFLENTEKQIILTLHDGLTIATENVKTDLEDIDKLLGEPIQKNLCAETGIQIFFESIFNIHSVNIEIIQRAQLLRTTVTKAIQMSQEASTRLEELQIQLSVLQRQCTYRDRPLCDTLRMKSFDEIGMVNVFQKLQTDPLLLKMLSLGHIEINSEWKNLSYELHSAIIQFRNYPHEVVENTKFQRKEIIQELKLMMELGENSSKQLMSAFNIILDRTANIPKIIQPFLDKFTEAGNLMWTIGLVTCLITLCVSFLLLCGMSCGCCHAENKGVIIFRISAITISFASIGLVIFSIFTILLGGHGEIFLCRPLYDYPNYNVLERLLDKPGLLYTNKMKNGILNELLSNSTVQPLNVSLGSILRECEANKSSYPTFELEKILNISAITNFKDYPRLVESFKNLRATEYGLNELTTDLENILVTILQDSNINLTFYRIEISKPTPEKDIATFTDQMQRVSLQIQDVATASRMSTLGSRTRRLQVSLMQSFEQLRSDVLYHLTALELQRDPFVIKVNQTFSHLKRVQYLFEQNSQNICLNQTIQYTQRLKSHLTKNHDDTQLILNTQKLSCRLIYDIFNKYRTFTCLLIMDSINGLWFICLLCMFLWIFSTPITLMLSTTYGYVKRARKLRHTNSQQYRTQPESSIISLSRENNLRGSVPEIDRSNW